MSRLYAAAARLALPELRSCFDPAYYLERYADVRGSGMDPLAHFLRYGAREGRQPDRLFDTRYYLSNNPDVADAGVNPLVHFLRSGWKEGRRPNPLFDAAFYISQNPRRPGENANPFVNYAARVQRGERPQGWLPFVLPSHSYQVATVAATRKQPASQLVDIIIPVYSGLTETRACLESLLSAAGQTPFEVILVNDHTPDPALGRYLRDFPVAHGWTLLENSRNLGFAAAVNRGLELHPERDVVVLNNDTEVANDWLDRLASAAVDRVGTVTPFSNNATLCSYPKPGVPNRVPRGVTVGELDDVFRQVNGGQRVAIPTAVGFCMYIRRECLKEVGEFRAEVFGKGYGEENDFSQRAIYKGWENVLAAGVFVYHAGETSFGREAEARRKAGVEAVERLHPDYSRRVGEHERRDPAKPYRIAVSAWRMRHSGKPVILSIGHELGGGVEQYVRELRESLTGRAEMLILTPTGSGAVVLRNADPDDEFRVAFGVDSDYPALLELLRACGVSGLHVQHLLGHELDVSRLKRDLGIPMDFSVHDYFTVCPQVTLTDPSGRYCGEPDTAACNVCLAGRPPWPRLEIEAWREKYGAVVLAADRVIAPSQDAADRLRRYFPGAKVIAAAHPNAGPGIAVSPADPLPPDSPLVIGVIGAMNSHKGIHRLRAVAKEARRRNLPVRFVVAGYVDPPADTEPFHQTGPYNNDELPGLLRDSGVHLVWFPAQWPETFSYTLSVCLETGLPVAAPDLGAFAERVAGRSWTWIVPWDWDTARMLEFFLQVRREHFVTGIPPAAAAGDGRFAVGGFYPTEYLR